MIGAWLKVEHATVIILCTEWTQDLHNLLYYISTQFYNATERIVCRSPKREVNEQTFTSYVRIYFSPLLLRLVPAPDNCTHADTCVKGVLFSVSVAATLVRSRIMMQTKATEAMI